MAVPDRTEYAQSLYDRLAQSFTVPCVDAGVFETDDGPWAPQPNQCHHNVSSVVAAAPEQLEPVRGWLVFDFSAIDPPRVEFVAHSVVRDRATGRNYDITPQQRLHADYLFLEADLSEPDYEALLDMMAFGEKLVHHV